MRAYLILENPKIFKISYQIHNSYDIQINKSYGIKIKKSYLKLRIRKSQRNSKNYAKKSKRIKVS